MSDLTIPDEARKAACDAYDRAVRRAYVGECGDGECEEIIAVRAAAPLIVAAFLDDLAAQYPADIFTPDGTSKDAVAGTALRTVLTAQAKVLRGESHGE